MSSPPHSKRMQPPYQNNKIKAKVKEKLKKVFHKGYIKIANIQMVESIMYMFDVVKGDDIHMVCDGSKQSLNDCIWAPWFALPTIDTMTWQALAGTWLAWPTTIMVICF